MGPCLQWGRVTNGAVPQMGPCHKWGRALHLNGDVPQMGPCLKWGHALNGALPHPALPFFARTMLDKV